MSVRSIDECLQMTPTIKEGSGNKNFKKSVQAGLRAGCLKKGARTPIRTMSSSSIDECLQMTATIIFDFFGLTISIKVDSSSFFMKTFRSLQHLNR